MTLNRSLLGTALVGGALALMGCVSQPTQPQTSTPHTATLASTTGAVLNGVLQANGGATGLMSSFGVPAAGTASNAAGVLTYCAKNNLLSADKAGAVANQLLTSLGLPTPKSATATAPTQDQGYLQGVAGMIVSPTGELFSLDKIKGNVKDKACGFVLDNAKSFL